MKIFSKKNVLEEALDRVRYLFDEFDDIVVGMSGGKDSTVVFNLALQVAREKNRLPLKVMWVDQEAEWQGTVDYVKQVMESPDVEPYWYQMPMVITNNASSFERYAYCWRETDKAKWIHPKDPMSIKENTYGTDRFHDLFGKIMAKDFPPNTAKLTGVRAEESPRRAMGLTSFATYKHITWGNRENPKLNQYVFHPIYDWSYTDVWKYINDNNIPYNLVYDEMYRYGVKVREMRISNLHHETAIQSLIMLQEIEPATWLKVSDRIDGANTIKHIKKNSFTCPKELPYMFKSWEEYALYLADHIVQEDEHRDGLYKKIDFLKDRYPDKEINQAFWQTIINTILSSDWDYTKLSNWTQSMDVWSYHAMNKGSFKKYMLNSSKYLTIDQKTKLVEHFSNGGKNERPNQ